jgi:hypothetical protein
MATKGTGWMVRRSRDLLPGLLQLALAEWWHGLRGDGAGLGAGPRPGPGPGPFAGPGADKGHG